MPDERTLVWTETDLVPVSALQHWSYCPRQCALIHVEQVWDENLYTLRGRRVHENVDRPEGETCEGVRLERALPIWSDRLGLVGKADVVEFHNATPYPVEYKHGPRRQREHDDLQLAAQALCLEEMFGRPVPCGAIYHHSSRRRREVAIDAPLRARVEEAVRAVRVLLAGPNLPPGVNDARCERCSLKSSCLPDVVHDSGRLRGVRRSLYTVNDSAAWEPAPATGRRGRGG
jgi:CRISPR-associated exonuclease Cas4